MFWLCISLLFIKCIMQINHQFNFLTAAIFVDSDCVCGNGWKRCVHLAEKRNISALTSIEKKCAQNHQNIIKKYKQTDNNHLKVINYVCTWSEMMMQKMSKKLFHFNDHWSTWWWFAAFAVIIFLLFFFSSVCLCGSCLIFIICERTLG